LIGHLDQEMILHAIDSTKINRDTLVSDIPLTNLDYIFERDAINTEATVALQLTGNKIEKYLSEPLKLGQWYQLGIELVNDDPKPDVHLFNFQLIPEVYKQVSED